MSWLDRMFPKTPDFRLLLTEQCTQVEESVKELSRLLDGEVDASALREAEAKSNELRRRNSRALDEAFSTPFDREDIQRALEEMDWIVVHSVRTAGELNALGLEPDRVMQDLVDITLVGVGSMRRAWELLDSDPSSSVSAAEAARKTDRKARSRYETGLAELFAGSDVLDILKRREIYHHLVDGAHRVRKAAIVLRSIQVKGA